MRRRMTALLSVLMVLICAISLIGCAKTDEENEMLDKPLPEYQNPYKIYVDKDSGSDTSNGTDKASPVQSIQAAKQLVRAYLQKGDFGEHDSVVVELAEGEYTIDETLEFTNEDSGALPVMWKGEDGKEVLLSGGKKIEGTWKAEENGIYSIPVPDADFREIYINGSPTTRARFPNASDDKFEESIEVTWNGENRDFGVLTSSITALPADKTDIEMHFAQRWVYSMGNILAERTEGVTTFFRINDRVTSIMFVRTSPDRAKGSTYCWFENSLSFLDSPGEWFYDKNEQLLYYMPRENEDMQSAKLTIPVLEQVVLVKGKKDDPIKNLRFSNLQFGYTGWNYPTENGFTENQAIHYYDGASWNGWGNSEPAAVEARWADGFVFDGNKIFNTAVTGLSLRYGVSNSIIKANKLENIGGNGISFGYFHENNPDFAEDEFDNRRNPYDLYAEKNFKYVTNHLYIQENYLKNIGIIFRSGTGLLGGYVNSVYIAHNEIEDVSYSGMGIGWGWGQKLPESVSGDIHVLRNKLTNVMNSTLDDGAAMYFLGVHSDKLPMSYVNENYVSSPKGAVLYFDMCTTFYRADSNVIEGENVHGALNLHDWEKALSDIQITNHYTETTNTLITQYPEYQGKTLEERGVTWEPFIVRTLSNDWPEEAYNVMENAGLREEYASVRDM